MTIKEFKQEAEERGNFYDNSKSASEQWAKTWGLTYWRLVWWYKEYRIGGMVYRSGMWRGRHGGRTITECEIDGEAVSKYRFEKVLATYTAPAMTAEEKERHEAQERERAQWWEEYTTRKYLRRSRRTRRAQESNKQLTLSFA